LIGAFKINILILAYHVYCPFTW